MTPKERLRNFICDFYEANRDKGKAFVKFRKVSEFELFSVK